MVFTYYIFEKTGLLSEIKIPTQIFKNFICCVRGKYRDNPFHNWYHGFSVLHFTYVFANLIGYDWLTRLELLAVFISSSFLAKISILSSWSTNTLLPDEESVTCANKQKLTSEKKINVNDCFINLCIALGKKDTI